MKRLDFLVNLLHFLDLFLSKNALQILEIFVLYFVLKLDFE
jgi:hypothetical protein